jgi:glutamate synthase domain-containing protein 2/glutamate synthase domain-containing protein 1/glutamate synthase domain-containing protein 3
MSHPSALSAERDACGIGFVADARGRPSRAIVETAVEALRRVKHRGALAADGLTGDGAGLLLPIPHRLFDLPARSGVGMFFVDRERADEASAIVETACADEGLTIASWREVPTDDKALGDAARKHQPIVMQALVERPLGSDEEDGERRAFRARLRVERGAAAVRLYVCSFSFRTVVYKALCAADRLSDFYPDLADERFEGWFAIFHQRFATNTTPTWERAQPFRFLAHNGEINTIRGNVALMRAREGHLASEDLAPDDLLRPVLSEGTSDSGIVDQVLELLTRGGRDLRHAATMMVPPAWESVSDMDAELRDFLAFHACLMEPWDGPAALVFTDGVRVAATLDRNGLRPMRISVCEDGLVVAASEVGAVTTRGHGRVSRERLGPGESFCVDPGAGGIQRDREIKKALASRRPYGDWIEANLHRGHRGSPHPGGEERGSITARQVAAGYTKEEITVVLRPMAVEGHEPTSSMGDDTAKPPLAERARPVFSYLKQRFAQVTNPPIDHLRERDVMSLSTRLGARDALLHERPAAAKLRWYETPLLFPDAVSELEVEGAVVLNATFAADGGAGGLRGACRRLRNEAVAVVREGAEYLIVSDRSAGPGRVSVPSALAGGAVHHALLEVGLRASASIVIEADDVRETHHVACLITNGTDAVSPRLALASIADLVASGRLGGSSSNEEAQERFFACISDGLLKVMSKMGIATLDSYRGAQIIESLGLGDEVIDTCFRGLYSPLGGLGFEELEEDVLARHAAAYAGKAQLLNPGFIKFKRGGDFHAYDPDVIDELHRTVGLKAPESEDDGMAAAHELRRAVRGSDAAYDRFAAMVNGRRPAEPRDLLEFVPANEPVPLNEVEPATQIAKRFSTGAMSHGALSAEAHETLSIALNMIGGMANTGEGGEAPERYADERNSGIKQIASGRFGVTPSYLAHAKELQIKMAQGSKPGEGGQLPGKKVTVEIARLRHTVPGVALISPPPHHDIYSIEDLAQLIFDLKQANPSAKVSVKLVSSEGVGTIAAGVVKALADAVHISGGDGGTGASPLSSIKNAGMPWETGLAEAQAALVDNGLRTRAKLRVDGGLKTGRDIMMAALLGADEFSFGTAALVAEGCILVRTCHRDTCPVGIATQNPALRAKFRGTPEMVARYLMLVAEEVRLLLSSLGLRSVGEAVGRTDLLRRRDIRGRTASVDVSLLLRSYPRADRRFEGSRAIQSPRSNLGDRLFEDAVRAIEADAPADLRYRIKNADRTVGARLGCALGNEIERRHGIAVRASFEGEAGQSFAAFLSDGIELTLTGEANDYVCKGMGGGRVVVRAPENDAGDPCLIGNTALYGATGGCLYVGGRAGERFAVRNSGAVAVVEGVGDHACEYMTAGAVVILGPVGKNLGAGMSGGEAYVFDQDGTIETHINPQLVDAYQPTDGQLASLHRVLERHAELTDSALGRSILDDWPNARLNFKRIAPVAEVARLEAMFETSEVAPA